MIKNILDRLNKKADEFILDPVVEYFPIIMASIIIAFIGVLTVFLLWTVMRVFS